MEIAMLEFLERCRAFQWDDGNSDKNWRKHQVSQGEIEQSFLNRPLVIASADQRNDRSQRYYALGMADNERLLFVVFTIRSDLIRVVSARPMSRRERRVYLNAQDTEGHP
jgi:uncharacterized DUF497 family protein